MAGGVFVLAKEHIYPLIIGFKMTSELRDNFVLDCQQAMHGNRVSQDLSKVAIRMRLAGLTQEEACQIIYSSKEAVTGTEFFEGTERDDAISDVLDGIVGYCASSCHIWSPRFDANKALADLEKRDT